MTNSNSGIQFTRPSDRSPEEWSRLLSEADRFLRDQARLEHRTTYTELNQVLYQRTGYRKFDFSEGVERGAIGNLLGQVSYDAYDEIGALLSSIVVYLNENDAGGGFYSLSEQMGLLDPTATKDERMLFWVGQINSVHAYFRRRRRRLRRSEDS